MMTSEAWNQPARVHRLTDAQFGALARGLGDAATVATLRAGQLSKRRIQLKLALDHPGGRLLLDHFALLREADRRAPGIGEELLGLPHTGAWLAASLRHVRHGTTDGAPPQTIWQHHVSWLGALAVVGALRARVDCAVDVMPYQGWVFLPTLGRVRTGEVERVRVEHRGGHLRVGQVEFAPGDSADAERWQPARWIASNVDGLALKVCLDDLDPFRGCHGVAAADRGATPTLDRWQELLDGAWPLLVRHHRAEAEAIASGLVTLVPLHASNKSAGVNVTSMDGFGAVAMTPPADARSLALGLLHEFRHAKLGATIDLIPLLKPDANTLYYAPWRDDPRPIGALLHGVYAFTAVTEFWRGQRQHLDGTRARAAEVEFTRWRDRVRQTYDTMVCSDSWTPAGRRFLDGMREAQSMWHDEPVRPEALEAAREAAEDHWVSWRLRNHRVDADVVHGLVAAWLNGAACPPTAVRSTVVAADRRRLSESARLDLARLRLLEPERFWRIRTGQASLAQAVPGACLGDLALVAGDFTDAGAAYQEDICQDPERIAAWIGLVVACNRGAEMGLDLPQIAVPELVLALHEELRRRGASGDPVALARWLAPMRDLATWEAAPGHN